LGDDYLHLIFVPQLSPTIWGIATDEVGLLTAIKKA